MSSSKVIYSLTPQESILYFYIKQHGWTRQRDLVKFRGKDDRRTRKILQELEGRGLLINRYKPYFNGHNTLNEKYYNLKH